MAVLADKAGTKTPWAMLFADDLVLVSETVEALEEECAVTGKMESRYREQGVYHPACFSK